MTAKNEKIRVLMIEDEPGVAKIIEEVLEQTKDFNFEVEWANTLKLGLEWLQQGKIDIVLLDLGLPDSKGYDTFSKLHAQAPKVPIILLTGLEDNAVALKAVQQGAQDYLVKGQLDIMALPRTICFAIERFQKK